jgi:hypothetical protein
MNKVFKYEITDEPLELPYGAMFLKVAMQNGKHTAWFEVNPEFATILRYFKVVGTGHDVPDGYYFLETYFEDPFVWHLYERIA